MGSSCFPAFLHRHTPVWRKCRLHTRKPSGCPLSSSEVLGSRFLQALGHRLVVATGPYRVRLPRPVPVAANTTRAVAPSRSGGGDSLVVSACLARKGIEDWLSRQKDGCSTATQHKEIGSLPSKGPPGENQAAVVGEELYRLEVALPPEKPESGLKEEKKHEKEAPLVYRKQLRFEGLECDMSLEENNRPEWTFTLYDFDNNGKVTRELRPFPPDSSSLTQMENWLQGSRPCDLGVLPAVDEACLLRSFHSSSWWHPRYPTELRNRIPSPRMSCGNPGHCYALGELPSSVLGEAITWKSCLPLSFHLRGVPARMSC
ncbi:NKD1 protein, partial [Polypterus senegalus]